MSSAIFDLTAEFQKEERKNHQDDRICSQRGNLIPLYGFVHGLRGPPGSQRLVLFCRGSWKTFWFPGPFTSEDFPFVLLMMYPSLFCSAGQKPHGLNLTYSHSLWWRTKEKCMGQPLSLLQERKKCFPSPCNPLLHWAYNQGGWELPHYPKSRAGLLSLPCLPPINPKRLHRGCHALGALPRRRGGSLCTEGHS